MHPAIQLPAVIRPAAFPYIYPAARTVALEHGTPFQALPINLSPEEIQALVQDVLG